MRLLLAAIIGALCVWGVLSDAYQAPSWACSPPPRMRNPLCPAPANGDGRCSLVSCTADAGCATENCNAVQGQVKSERTLVLDAWFQRGTACIKSTWTLSECCSLCSSLAGCSAWSYCNNPAGCGADCAADYHDFQFSRGLNLWNVDPTDYPTRLNPEHSCLTGGRWPYNTCSLKVAAAGIDAKAPALEPGSESSGWVSGVFSPSSELAGSNPPMAVQLLKAIDSMQPQNQQNTSEQLQPVDNNTSSADLAHGDWREQTANQSADAGQDQGNMPFGQTQESKQQRQLKQPPRGYYPQPKLVDRKELDNTIENVMDSNPQSRTMPQQPVSNPVIVPSVDESVKISELESAASTLETPTANNSTRIAVSEGQMKILKDVRSAQQVKPGGTGNAAHTVGSSASMLCAAAVGAVVLIASLV